MKTFSRKQWFIDTKRIVYDMLTTNGDIYYDYGKLYQSILGYDLVLHLCTFTPLKI